jgi:hypothetical protein
MATKKYTKSRPRIPNAIKRVIKVEAKHSCIVCRERVSLQLHHIDGNRENNDPSNIVCLCGNCHGMEQDGKITAADLREYKKRANQQDEEVNKLKAALDHILGVEKITVSEDFVQLKLKYHNLLNDYGDKLIFLQSFIYLIPEFYIDQRGEEVRKLIRDLLGITPEEEQMLLSHLNQLGILDIVGGLVTLKSKQDAQTALNELINSKKIDLSKLVEKFVQI